MTRMEVVVRGVEGMEKMWRGGRLVEAFAASKKWFALARRKELGWDEQGSCIGNLTAYVAAVVVTESMRR
jgi:hypothetical protein